MNYRLKKDMAYSLNGFTQTHKKINMRPQRKDIAPMIQMTPVINFLRRKNNNITILIMEDNEYFNTLLAHELDIYVRDLQIIRNFKYEIVKFTDVKKCIQAIKENKFDQSRIIAFVDYYLGDGINGAMILKKLITLNPENKVIMMSQTQNSKLSSESKSMGAFEFVFKNNDAPFKCCLVLEQLISSYFGQ
jgi:DNA-binding NtrC family response regulator